MLPGLVTVVCILLRLALRAALSSGLPPPAENILVDALVTRGLVGDEGTSPDKPTVRTAVKVLAGLSLQDTIQKMGTGQAKHNEKRGKDSTKLQHMFPDYGRYTVMHTRSQQKFHDFLRFPDWLA